MNTKQLLINDYVSNDTEANSVITDFTTNKYIIKGSTGIGGTSAVFNITNQTVIIVSPLVGMIKGKEEKSKENGELHHRFIYGESIDRWSDVLSDLKAGKNIIINTTPENLMMILKSNGDIQNDLKLYINTIPMFVDEFDIYTNATYRINQEEDENSDLELFFHYLFNNHEANITLSTATPAKDYLDIPPHIKLEYYTISRIDEPIKQLEVFPIKSYKSWVKTELNKGRKVVLFTNDINKINRFRNYNEDIKTQLLVGDDLSIKVSETKGQDYEEFSEIKKATPDYTNDLFILSSRYLIGFDFEVDCSIAIIADESDRVDGFVGGEIAQAYGRARKNVHNAALFFRKTASNNEPIEIESSDKDYTKEVESELLVNYGKVDGKDKNFLKIISPIVSEIHRVNTYYNLKEYMSSFGFNLSFNNTQTSIESLSGDFGSKYREVANQDYQVTAEQFNHICDHIKGDDIEYNGYTKKRLLIWAAATLSEFIPFLSSLTPQRYSELLNVSKAVVDLNELEYPIDTYAKIATTRAPKKSIDWAYNNGGLVNESVYRILIESSNNDIFNKARKVIHTLYKIEQVKNDKYSEKTFNFITAISDVHAKMKSNLLKYIISEAKDFEKYYEDKDFDKLKAIGVYILCGKRLSSILKKDVKKLASVKLLDEKEMVQVKNKVDNVVSTFRKYDREDDKLGKKLYLDIKHLNKSVELQKKRHEYYLLSLLSMDIAGHMNGFIVTKKDNRDYNPATKCTRQFRSEVPFELAEYDIKSAFPTILNQMIGSDNNKQYESLIDNLNITRGEAKVKFNSMLNSTHFITSKAQINKFKEFFINCGYTKEEVVKIHRIATGDGTRGSFFRKMAAVEKRIINSFVTDNKIDRYVRLHDSVIFYNTIDGDKMIMEFENIKFGYEIKS